MIDKKKKFTKLHLYFLVVGGLLMIASTSFEHGYVDWLLGTIALAIFLPTLVSERHAKKIEQGKENTPIRHGLIGSIIGGVEAGVSIGILYYFFMPYRYGQRDIMIVILFTLVGLITGAIVGFLITYLPKKRKFEPIT